MLTLWPNRWHLNEDGRSLNSDQLKGKNMFEHIESMQEMKNRLGHSGSSGQVKAVIDAINAINKAEGWLDQENRATALFHLAVALGGTKQSAIATLEHAVFIAQSTD